MAGSTFQPPIHLDPNQDSAQQIAFINQNFQNLAATLETNSFRVVDIIDTTFNSPSLSTGTNTWNSVSSTLATIPHNLSFVPIPFGFAVTTNGIFKPLEFSTATVTAGSPFWEYYRVSVDSTNVYVVGTIIGYNINVTSGPFTVKIYLTQLSAS